MRLLLVEQQASPLTTQLCDDRHCVVDADSPDEALSLLRYETYDLVVLNLNSFAESGFAFIPQLRARRNDTPLVALTGQRADERVRALGLGADDAVSEPVDASDLQARIVAVTRRYRGHAQSIIRVGALALSLENQNVWVRDKPVHLTGKQYLMLELLMLRRGQVVTKEMFLNHLYGGM